MTVAVMASRAPRGTENGAAPRRLSINESVICAELDDEAVLLHAETGIYFGLDAVGARIWALLSRGADERVICDRLLAEYDVEPARLRSDVADFLALLESMGLARAVDG